jgi:hypothetical protein
MMDDTSGFYKRDPGGILLFGRYFVLNADYHLKRDHHATYEYPIDGWSWYDSEDEAREALNFPSKLEEAFNAMTDDEKRRLLGLEA